MIWAFGILCIILFIRELRKSKIESFTENDSNKLIFDNIKEKVDKTLNKLQKQKPGLYFVIKINEITDTNMILFIFDAHRGNMKQFKSEFTDTEIINVSEIEGVTTDNVDLKQEREEFIDGLDSLDTQYQGFGYREPEITNSPAPSFIKRRDTWEIN
tara:strand:- start:1024 stop:1494 length:471 start_codon:yes stop_codon:yes gene_type:complete